MSDEAPAEAPLTLFLSYARADKALAERVGAALRDRGYILWWDALIEGGAQFATSIRAALEAADAVVVLWSRHSIESDWVRDEAALGRDRHRLVPLSLDGSEAPLGFRQYQTIDLSAWRGQSDAPEIVAVERSVARIAGRSASPEPPKVGGPRLSRRGLVGAGIGVGVLAVGGAGALAWREGWFPPADSGSARIAVIPFKALAGGREQDDLAQGLSEEVRSALMRNPALQVLAATSSAAASGADAKAIARKLDVSYLLEGAVQRSGNRVRVSTNLTDGRTGFSLWAQTVQRELTDIFAFEADIARSVAEALSVRMATEDPSPGGTRNVRAYEAYLRGRALFNLAKDEETDRASRGFYEVALAADPRFALAQAGLSRVLSAIAGEHASAAELKPLYSAAIAAARRAVALAPTLAEGHLALGYALFSGRLDIKGARPSYERAYRYGHGNADVVLLYALYTVRARRFAEARAAIERAVALDPLNPRTFRAAGTIAYASRRYADALDPFRRALALNPQMANVHAFLGHALLQLGRMDEARTALAAEPNDIFRTAGLAILEHRLGRQAEAERQFAALVKEGGDAAVYQQAEVLAQWGRADAAIERLERARAIGDSGLIYITTDPMLDPLARDPRYLRLIKQLNFA